MVIHPDSFRVDSPFPQSKEEIAQKSLSRKESDVLSQGGALLNGICAGGTFDGSFVEGG